MAFFCTAHCERMVGMNPAHVQLRREAFRLAGWQVGLTALIAAISWLLGGPGSALSAAAGGGIGTLAGLYQSLRMFSVDASEDPSRFLRAVYVGQVVKLLLTAALFILVIKTLSVEFLPLIIGYAATFTVYWMALKTGFPRVKQDVRDESPAN